MRPTEKDIQTTTGGYYYLPCDGRHDPMWHRYMFYTKKQVIQMWRDEHPQRSTEKRVHGDEYSLTVYADGFNRWYCRADFNAPGVGNTPQGEAIKYAAVKACKRKIRKEIVDRELPKRVGKLSYEVVANRLDSLNRMWSITVAEK